MTDMTDEEVAQAMELARAVVDRKWGQENERAIARLALHLAGKLAQADLTPEKLAAVKARADAIEWVENNDELRWAIRDCIPDLVAEIEQAEAEVEKAREDLRRYGRHVDPCMGTYSGFVTGECTCGFDAALKGEPA